MTLQQLKYALEIADRGSINEAARCLFISQPSLSNAIKELEKEIGTAIFVRSNTGVGVSAEGKEFLGYARQVLQQYSVMHQRYVKSKSPRKVLSISTQQYSDASHILADIIESNVSEMYDVVLRESTVFGVIDDVRKLYSEIGVLYINDCNRKYIFSLMKEKDLTLQSVQTTKPYVFLNKNNPLANRKILSLNELAKEPYPYVYLERGHYDVFRSFEDRLSNMGVKKKIRINDRSDAAYFLRKLNGYTISTAIGHDRNHADVCMTVPLDCEDEIDVCSVVRKNYTVSAFGESYLQALTRLCQQQPPT